MRISAKTDYAIRAAVEMAARIPAGGADQRELIKAEAIADAQAIPLRFLLTILSELRHAGIVESRRGQDGGYRLARDPAEITIADIIRAIDGPLANIAGIRPEALDLTGSAAPLRDVWIVLRSNIRAVLERVTLADLVAGEIPPEVAALAEEPDAWVSR
jgi:Rrf2 family protein